MFSHLFSKFGVLSLEFFLFLLRYTTARTVLVTTTLLLHYFTLFPEFPSPRGVRAISLSSSYSTATIYLGKLLSSNPGGK